MILVLLGFLPCSRTVWAKEDVLFTLPVKSELVAQSDVLIPSGSTQILIQKGSVHSNGEKVDGNERFCILSLAEPKSRDRVIEKGVSLVLNQKRTTHFSNTTLGISNPAAIIGISCFQPPKDLGHFFTVSEFKEVIVGVFELDTLEPEPIR